MYTNTKLRHRSKFLLRTVAALVVALCLSMGMTLTAGASGLDLADRAGALYGFGIANNGRTGLGFANASVSELGTRAGDAQNWRVVAASTSASFGIDVDGRLFSWGGSALGQSGQGVIGGDTLVPTQIGTASNWVTVSGGNQNAYAINSLGHMYAWGWNGFGQIGNGIIGDADPDTIIWAPVRIAPETEWAYVSAGINYVLAICRDGELFGWGQGGPLSWHASGQTAATTAVPTAITNAENGNWAAVSAGHFHSLALTTDGRLFAWGDLRFGRTGQDHTLGSSAVPTQVGDRNNWTAIAANDQGSIVLNDDGEIYSFGSNLFGAIAQGTEAGYVGTPTRVGTDDNWESISSFTNNGYAINTDGEIFAWGQNLFGGMTGAATDVTLTTPTLVETEDDIRWLAVVNGPFHGMAIGFPASPLTLTKTLQMPEGTTPPAASFTFRFQATGITDSVPAAQVPTIDDQIVPVDLTTATTVPSSGITTVTGTLDLWTLIYDLPFDGGGTFVWNVWEVRYSSLLHNPPTTYMAYDDARFQIRAIVDRDGDLHTVLVFVLNEDYTVGEKLEGGMNFLNTFSRRTGAFEVTKEVTGTQATLLSPFYFVLTLTEPTIGARIPTAGIVAPVVDRITGVAVDPARSVTVFSGVNEPFRLYHNEALAIPNLPIGTTAVVTEQIAADYIAAYVSISGGIQVGYDENEEPGQILTATAVLVQQEGRNATDFTNDHQWTPPTGLVLSNPVWMLSILAVLGLVLVIAVRKRKTIEELPLM